MDLKPFAVALGLTCTPAMAFDFGQRMDAGDRAVATEAGQDYLERLGPSLASAIDTCTAASLRGNRGETLTFIAWVTPEGTLQSALSEPASPAAQCLRQALEKAQVSPPAGWNWERSDFPLTVRVGFVDAAPAKQAR
jgi:hypothetical protein